MPTGPSVADGRGAAMVAAAEAAADDALARYRVAAAALGAGPVVGVDVDGRGVLAERRMAAATDGFAAAPPPGFGAVSWGGACRLLAARDGWVAVTLGRADDVELLPAWLGVDPAGVHAVASRSGRSSDLVGDDVWSAVAEALCVVDAAEAAEQGQVLGLAVARVPSIGARPDDPIGGDGAVAELADLDEQLEFRAGGHALGCDRLAAVVHPLGPPASPGAAPRPLRVVDLSSLWAGPRCGRMLADLGWSVTKVESTTRPDGARLGSPAFFAALNDDKAQVALPLATDAGRRRLVALLDEADVVIEGSRPRALEQMGVDPRRWASRSPGRVWVSITAYGRTGPWRNRVGFGDDTAAAGGLLGRTPDGAPCFVGDAVADPLAGLTAAAVAVGAVADGGGVMVDVALREVARSAAGRVAASPIALSGVLGATP